MSTEETTKSEASAPSETAKPTCGLELASPQIGKLAEALAAAQAVVTQPQKNRVAKVRSRKGEASSYEYRYADLSDVIDAIREPFSKHGLAFTQPIFPVAGKPCLVTTLLHSSGQWIRSIYPLPGAMSSQEMLGNITYGRRYSLCAIAGISGETDTDGMHPAGADEGDQNESGGDEQPPPQTRTHVRKEAAKGRLKSAHDGHVLTPDEAAGTGKNTEAAAPFEGGASDDMTGIAKPLADLMARGGITPGQLMSFYVGNGTFPDSVDPAHLPADYVTALVKPANWKRVVATIKKEA